jgi:DNA-binding winged helix-turn-helix (wHTH) protein
MLMNSRAGVLRTSVEHIVYIFEGFRLDAGRRQLSSSGGVVVPLNSRPMEALVMLVSRAGELVTKRQLLEGVWPAAVVEDNNINQCILAIRKALGESAGSNRFVMTVPGRGYRFVAPVVLQKLESPEATAADAAARLEGRRWWAFGLPGVAAAALMALIVMDTSREEAALPLTTVQNELVVHLRRDNAAPAVQQADVLLACLRQRPDLHLQVEVHVVGGESGPPLWTGRYIAGAQDLLPGAAVHSPVNDACQQLAAR